MIQAPIEKALDLRLGSKTSLCLVTVLCMLLSLYFTPPSQAEALVLGDFSRYQQMPQAPWQIVRFDEDIAATRYSLTQQDGVAAVHAQADASMALLARPLDIDLEKTPVLCWRWWVDQPIAAADMKTKDGDDYAARVYVTFDLLDSALSFGTRMKLGLARTIHGDQLPDAAINYIWDNRHPVGTHQANAYTDRAQMLVLRSGTEDSGRWVTERRHLLEDLKLLFGTEAGTPRQLAVASDTDNTGASASALFADLHLVSPNQPCHFSSALNTQ